MFDDIFGVIEMTVNWLGTVLGHPLDSKVIALMEEVQGAFPSKKLLIHPLELAEEESGKSVDQKNPAVSMPEINDYIAVWIKKEFSTEEFNGVLAEELIHHLQAYQQFPEITCLKSMSGVSLEQCRNFLADFRQEMTSVIYDINAHFEMKQREISLDQILRSDLMNVRNAIADANSSPQKLRELKEGKGEISGFPAYLLWWFDLFELDLPPYVDYWRQEIDPWFCEHVNESVMRTWKELTGFIHQYPVIDPLSAQRALTEICMTLLNCVPTFSPKRTSGRSLQVLLMKDLVPK